MVEKIREEGEKWVIKQGEWIFIYLFLSPHHSFNGWEVTNLQS